MEQLVRSARQLFGVSLTHSQVEALSLLENELLEWNQRVNLTAIRDPQGIRIKHFLDSFSCVLAWKDKPPQHLIDIGTGAGFPGLPLKIIYPSMHLTLVDSIGKKTAFCRHMVEKLKMKDVEVITARAEAVGQIPAHRQAYDWALARAVAAMPALMEYLLPLVRRGGAALAEKGPSGFEEAQKAEKAISILGGRLRSVIPVTLPGVVEERCLVVVDKVAATPPLYPRLPGMPAKKPL